MANKETYLQRQIMLLDDERTLLFRNTAGAAWQGSNFRVVNGRLVEGNARYVVFGLAKGSSDIIGGRSVVVTEEMLGHTIMQFSAIEAKDEGKYPTPEQKAFIAAIKSRGGLAGIARNIEQAKFILDGKNR